MKYDNLVNIMVIFWEVVKKMVDYYQFKVYKFKLLLVIFDFKWLYVYLKLFRIDF